MHRLTFAVMGMLALGCTPGNGPLYVSGVQDLSALCEPVGDEDAIVTGFELVDVAADPKITVLARVGGGPNFFSTASQPPLIVTGRTLAPDGRDSLLIQKIVLRYTAKPAIPGLGPSVVDTIPRTVTLTKDKPELVMTVPLFGPTARKQFRALIASNTDAPIQFTSSFEIQGTTASGAEFRTPPVSMPMNIIKSEITCPSTDSRLRRFESDATADADACKSVGVNRRLANATMYCCNALDPMTQAPRVTATPGCDIIP